MLTKVAQAGSWGECVPSKVLRGQGEEHLPAVGCGQEAGQTIQPGSQIVPILGCSSSRMQRHADPNGSYTLRPVLLPQWSLGIERGSDRMRGCRKGCLHRVANHFENNASVGRNGFPEQLEVALA